MSWTAVWRAFEEHGLLMLQDAAIPALAQIVAGGPIRGSWWSHPQSHAIFALGEKLSEHADVLETRLVNRKVTFVHRRLWPALLGVATCRSAWQVDGLSAEAEKVLAGLVGSVRTDQHKIAKGVVTELDDRLLVRPYEVHTESGRHARVLEPWADWATREGVEPIGEPDARRALEAAVSSWPSAKLPWR